MRRVVALDVLGPRTPTLWERIRERMTGKAAPRVGRVPATVLVRHRSGAAVTLYADADEDSLRALPNPVDLKPGEELRVWVTAPADLELVVSAAGLCTYVKRCDLGA